MRQRSAYLLISVLLSDFTLKSCCFVTVLLRENKIFLKCRACNSILQSEFNKIFSLKERKRDRYIDNQECSTRLASC